MPITIVWLDFDGMERSYGEVAPGRVWSQRTYTGHVWVLGIAADEDGRPRTLRRFTMESDERYEEVCAEGDALFVTGEEASPDEEEPAQRLCSTPSSTSVTMEIHNACGRAVEFFWVAFDCTLSTRGTISAGAVFRQRSYLGHVWQVRDARGRVLDHFVVGAGATRTRIECD